MATQLPAEADVTIIGAGPAGVAAAAMLNREGFSVCVLEKATFPRFVIGESLLPRCNDLLDEVGLLEAIKEQEYLVKRGAMFLRGEERCHFDFSEQHTDGWEYTYQVPRNHFDQVLAEGAIAQGVDIRFGHIVEEVRVGANPWVRVTDPDGESHEITSKWIIDASGYGRVLPRALDLDMPSHLAERHAVYTWVEGDKREEGRDEGRIWLCMHEGGAWIWIIPFSNGKTSVGVVGTPEFWKDYPGDPAAKLKAALAAEPNAASRLADATFCFEPIDHGGYSVGVSRLWGEGYCLVGNTTEFLDPIFSAGVTLALESAVSSAKVLVRKLRGEAVDWDKEYVEPLMSGVDVFRAYINGWYDGTLPKIFFSDDPEPIAKSQVCSVLAGYAWDETNPYVTNPSRQVPRLLQLIAFRDKARAQAAKP